MVNCNNSINDNNNLRRVFFLLIRAFTCSWVCLLMLIDVNISSVTGLFEQRYFKKRQFSVTTLNWPQPIACVDRRRNKVRHGCDCLADCNSRHRLFHMHVQFDFYSYLPTRFDYLSFSSGQVNSPASGCGLLLLPGAPWIVKGTPVILLHKASLRY